MAVPCELFFAIVVHHQMDAVLFFEGKLAVLVDELYFIGIQSINGYSLMLRLCFSVTDEIVHGGVEEIGNQHQCGNVRFNFVILVFIDGLLCQTDRIRKFLLTDSMTFPEQAEIFNHNITFRYYDNNSG